jgi:hypothetical protein
VISSYVYKTETEVIEQDKKPTIIHQPALNNWNYKDRKNDRVDKAEVYSYKIIV